MSPWARLLNAPFKYFLVRGFSRPRNMDSASSTAPIKRLFRGTLIALQKYQVSGKCLVRGPAGVHEESHGCFGACFRAKGEVVGHTYNCCLAISSHRT